MTCEQKDSSKLIAVHGSSLRLSIRGLGPVPSFKNKKRAILDSRTGKLRTLTEKRAARWMKVAIRSIESQLRSGIPTTVPRTLTGHVPRFWIASFLPLDDSRQWIPELVIRNEQVAPGLEGADVLIERII